MSIGKEEESNDSNSLKEPCENSILAEAGLQSAEMPLVLDAINVTFEAVALIEEWNDLSLLEVIKALTSWWLTNSVLSWGASFEMIE